MTTATIAITIGEHIFETLYAFDAAYNPQPLLASGETVKDGGKRLVITLRQDVVFHNGKQMTSADVVASLKRWGEFGSRGKLLMANATSLEATGEYEITLQLSEPNGAWKSMLAYPEGGPVIYPGEIAGKAGDKPIDQKDYIGTGPYKFKEWRPNRYIELERFDGYKTRSRMAMPARGRRRSTPCASSPCPTSAHGSAASRPATMNTRSSSPAICTSRSATTLHCGFTAAARRCSAPSS
jgi:peptide/nickel transport system substrate-binding protein